MVPLNEVPATQIRKRRRRRNRSNGSTEDLWSQGASESGGRGESRQMFWMLAGGGTLFAVAIAVVLWTILNENAPPVVVNDHAGQPPAPAAEVDPASVHLTDAEFVTAAEPIAREFLAAASVEQLIPLVRNPEKAEPRIRTLYPEGKFVAPGMAAFNTGFVIARQGAAMSVFVRTNGMQEKQLTFFPSAEGLKIDWESWAGWSDVPWQEFMDAKPSQATLFRVVLSAVDYYNFGFTDDSKWQSYRLVSPDDQHALYGYVERGSPLDLSLRLSSDASQSQHTLLLAFPPDAVSNNQVLIAQKLAEGWVLDTED